MMKDFRTVLRRCGRKIVIHETCCYDDWQILNVLQQNDILFLDDCLYSQYVFLLKNMDALKDKNIACVLGFSTLIFRREDWLPIYDAHCAEFHNRVHSGDESAYAAYMSISEIEELLKFENILLACHGDAHLDLHLEQSKMQKMKLFSDDIYSASMRLKQLGFSTDIFVYPYAYDDILLCNHILKKNGFIKAFAGKDTRRLTFESLIVKKPTLE